MIRAGNEIIRTGYEYAHVLALTNLDTSFSAGHVAIKSCTYSH